MDFTQFQQAVWQHSRYPSKGKNATYPTLGLQQAVGEVSQKVKHIMREDEGRPDKKRWDVAIRIGEVLRSCALLATEVELDLGVIADKNLEKVLAKRSKSAV